MLARRVASLIMVAWLLLVSYANGACAHAALVKSEPADRAVVAVPPAALILTFNEPVAPLVMRLIGPRGDPIALVPPSLSL